MSWSIQKSCVLPALKVAIIVLEVVKSSVMLARIWIIFTKYTFAVLSSYIAELVEIKNGLKSVEESDTCGRLKSEETILLW